MPDAIANREVVLAGRTFKLTKPVVAYWQAVTEHVRSSRPDPLQLAVGLSSRTPRDAIAGLFAGAFEAARKNGTVTFQDVAEFERTPEGLAYRFSLAVAVHHGSEFADYDAACRFVMSLDENDAILLSASLTELGR